LLQQMFQQIRIYEHWIPWPWKW